VYPHLGHLINVSEALACVIWLQLTRNVEHLFWRGLFSSLHLGSRDTVVELNVTATRFVIVAPEMSLRGCARNVFDAIRIEVVVAVFLIVHEVDRGHHSANVGFRGLLLT
jgi:hypothetical protein